MSQIKAMNRELEAILGRHPTIHEQIDMILFGVIKERLMELSILYQLNKEEETKKQYEHALKCGTEIQDRNPEIFRLGDSEGDNDV